MRAIEKNSLIVSCQASQSDPLYGSEIMAKMALAAQIGGARGIRADSPEDVQAIKKIVNLTVIGIWKCDLVGYDVYITPTFDHAKAILESGADYVAIDCTNRKRPEDLADILSRYVRNFPIEE